MRIWGIHKKYPSLSWWENFMGGHISIGNITIYGENAMCWAVNIRTKRFGAICFTLPSISRKKRKRKHYFYLSPNGTPWAATYYLGDKKEAIKAKIRKLNFGHGFNSSDHYKRLRVLNNKFDSFIIDKYDVQEYNFDED